MLIRPQAPQWLQRAREIQARVKAPLGKPFAAAKKAKVAELYLYDAIGYDEWSQTGIAPQDVVDAVKEAAGADSLAVHINSPGGYVFDGIAIFNAIRSFEGLKTVYVDGIAASIASVIALAGDKVVTNEGGTWMVHDPMGGIFSFGTADQIEEDAMKTVKALRKVRDNLIDIYVNATGKSVSQISAWMTGETWMTADEALERGFTDEVVKQSPPEEEKPAAAVIQLRPEGDLSPRVRADLARARARALQEKFARASPGKNPGQPGPTNSKTVQRPE
jgi:ATP-dependent Clp protease protease subunit